MEKLELKHLAPYLPYKLKTVNFNVGKLLNKPLISEMIPSNILCFIDGTTEQKILLRPLSDLTKEIEVDGNKFVPYKDLEIELDIILLILDGAMSINNLAYSDVEYLIKWHFDVFELIEKGLAIDINTLNND